MKKITTRDEYHKLCRDGNRGHFPRVLTSDGFKIDQEFKANYDQWKPTGTVIAHIGGSYDWPSYGTANRARIRIKKTGGRN